MTQRQIAKQKTRSALIRAGLALFAEQGLDAPSLDAICEHAGYTRGAFYVHFEDRDDFLAAVMETAGGSLLDLLIGQDEATDLATTVERFMQAFADGTYPLAPAGGIKPHQLLEACARLPRVRELYGGLVTEAMRRTSRVIDASQQTGGVRSDVNSEHVGALLLAAVIGAQTVMELGIDFDLRCAASAALQMLTPQA